MRTISKIIISILLCYNASAQDPCEVLNNCNWGTTLLYNQTSTLAPDCSVTVNITYQICNSNLKLINYTVIFNGPCLGGYSADYQFGIAFRALLGTLPPSTWVSYSPVGCQADVTATADMTNCISVAGPGETDPNAGNPNVSIISTVPCDKDGCCGVQWQNPGGNQPPVRTGNLISTECAGSSPILTSVNFYCLTALGLQLVPVTNISAGACMSICDKQHISAKTDRTSIIKKIETGATNIVNPTLFSNSISLTNIESIQAYRIISIDGKVFKDWTKPNQTLINTTEISKGIYFLQIVQERGSLKSMKIIKE